MFRAFFEQGRDIGDHAVIEAVGQESGLGAETLAAFNKPDEARDEVVAEEKRLRGFGVMATPNLLINGRVLVPGPADVSTYVQALDQALFPQLPSDKNAPSLRAGRPPRGGAARKPLNRRAAGRALSSSPATRRLRASLVCPLD